MFYYVPAGKFTYSVDGGKEQTGEIEPNKIVELGLDGKVEKKTLRSEPPEGDLLPEPKKSELLDPRRALVIIKVPEDAVVKVDDIVSKRNGTERQMITPPLDSTRLYYYDVSVTVDGKTKVYRISIQSGKTTTLDAR